MAHEERLGKFDQLYKRIEGETVDSQPAFAAACFLVDVAESQSLSSYCLITSGSYNYSVQTAQQDKPSGYKGAYFILDIYSVPASGTLLFSLDVRNPCDGEFSAFAQGSYIYGSGSAAGVRKYLVYTPATDTDSLLTHVTQLPIPPQWRARVNTAGGSGFWGYSLGVQYLE